MKIVAHRGGSVSTPENTLAAFASALALGVDGIELDVQVSKDGVPVVIHDATLDRTTTGRGPVSERTAAELKEFDAGNGERIPTLRDVFELVSDRVPLILEIKALAAAEPVCALLRAFPEVRWIGLCRTPEAYETLRAAFPEAELAIGTLGSRMAIEKIIRQLDDSGRPESKARVEQLRKEAETFDIADIFAQADALKASKLVVHFESVDAGLIEQARQRGLRIGAWTVNDPEVARKLAESGVDSLITDDPATMLALVRG